ncbi:hypothetical protein ASG17_14590 [Brevundimonas sp. Leaf363]|uniref:BrnT family toxin n=1 Tax=Brevundimonas sp. Leaf363 TaxID=1736353 RepID=UPI0006FEAC21|nr:BrnT family toxin [Brevundimonas sp. Leaf363]KQS53738.1 hypothetical protein ASG17_14590 [Brevundimonas sp. Leaf363]
MIVFDPSKDAANLDKHGVSLGLGAQMKLDGALIVPSPRADEDRSVAYGLIEDRLFVMVFTARGEDLRVISLRKANARERRQYDAVED